MGTPNHYKLQGMRHALRERESKTIIPVPRSILLQQFPKYRSWLHGWYLVAHKKQEIK